MRRISAMIYAWYAVVQSIYCQMRTFLSFGSDLISVSLNIDGLFKMWYTGQAHGNSYIGYAESENGVDFRRVRTAPVIYPQALFEGESVMNPCVLYENGIYRMWYSAGETYEPNVLCCAESTDGVK